MNVERPKARRIRSSKWASAAVVIGVAPAGDSSAKAVVLGMGGGIWVARNMLYVCTEERMNKQERGMTGRPRRLMRFWLTKALV